ncbi:MAG: TrmH family RNA methyltransferase [Fibrobacterota bacterium]
MPVGARSIKWYADLHKRANRMSEGYFMAEGRRVVQQLVAGGLIPVEILSTEKKTLFGAPDIPLRSLTQSQMKKIGSTQTPPSLMGVFSVGDFYSYRLPAECGERILFLEDVQDPGNIGTLLRSAVAFGFSGVIMTDGCADHLSAKVVRSTAGALCHVWIRRSSSVFQMLHDLHSRGYRIITLDLNGHRVLPSWYRERLILGLGNEGAGISTKLKNISDWIYTIDFESQKIESLNVSVAGSLAMQGVYKN